MKNLEDLLINIKQLNLDKMEVRDSLYRISDWLTYEDHSVKDNYIQSQFEFLDKLIEKNKDYSKVNSLKPFSIFPWIPTTPMLGSTLWQKVTSFSRFSISDPLIPGEVLITPKPHLFY